MLKQRLLLLHILLKVHDILSEHLLIVRVLLQLLSLRWILCLALEQLDHLGCFLEVGDLFLDLSLNLGGQLLEGLLLLHCGCRVSSRFFLVSLLVKVQDILSLHLVNLLLLLSSLSLELCSNRLLLEHLVENLLDLCIFNEAL